MTARIMISGGGTAGHVLPGISLAEEIQSINGLAEIKFVGTSQGQETKLVPKKGFKLELIEVSGLRRKASFESIKTLIKIYKAYKDCLKLIDNFQPNVVVGMGGYVSVPPVLAARRRQKKIILHEQNLFPGLANRILYRFADLIAISYTPSLSYFARKKSVVITGNPIRPEITKTTREEGLLQFKLSTKKKTILVFGGSQGARKINKALLAAYSMLRDRSDLQIIHLTGKIDHAEVVRALENIKAREDKITYQCYPFIDKMGSAYAVADLAVARAGATSIAEITARGIPCIFVPYPYATDDHQRKNAELLVNEGAARMILDQDLTGDSLVNEINDMINDNNKLSNFAEKTKKLGKPDAGKALAEIILKQIEEFF